MRKGTFKMRERGCQMRHFRAIAQDLAALRVRGFEGNKNFEENQRRKVYHPARVVSQRKTIFFRE